MTNQRPKKRKTRDFMVHQNHYFKAIVNSTTIEHNIADAVEEGVGPGEVGNGAGGGAGYGRFLPSRGFWW